MDSTLMAKQDFTTQELQLLASEMEKRKKSSGASWLLLLFLGAFGAHRFYLGDIGVGLIMAGVWLISIPFAMIPIAIWVLIELFTLSGLIRSKNELAEREVVSQIRMMRQAKMNDINQRLQQHGAQTSASDSISLEK